MDLAPLALYFPVLLAVGGGLATLLVRQVFANLSQAKRNRRKHALLRDALLHDVIENVRQATAEDANLKKISRMPVAGDFDLTLWRAVGPQFLESTSDADVMIQFTRFFSMVDRATRLESQLDGRHESVHGALPMPGERGIPVSTLDRSFRRTVAELIRAGHNLVMEYGSGTQQEALPDLPEEFQYVHDDLD